MVVWSDENGVAQIDQAGIILAECDKFQTTIGEIAVRDMFLGATESRVQGVVFMNYLLSDKLECLINFAVSNRIRDLEKEHYKLLAKLKMYPILLSAPLH